MTDIRCRHCGHVRETTEPNPTLVACLNCGSRDLEYTNEDDGCYGGV